MNRDILVIFCGGTIALVENPQKELILIPNTFENILRNKLKAENKDVPSFDFLEIENIVESNNLASKGWINIAKKIKTNYGKYGSFVIVSGTDTLAYFGSALSFMLENLQKPVILTGAQRPLYTKNTDGLFNIICSLKYAESKKYKEVLLCFGKEILRGNRSRKVDNVRDKAFISPNFKLLPTKIQNDSVIPPLRIFLKMKTKFLVFRITPNFDYASLIEMIDNVKNLKMIIIELFGLGTASSHKDRMIKLLHICKKNGVLVLAVTQNIFGGIREVYRITKEFEKENMLFAGDMTTEAACTKLCYLYGKYDGDREKIKLMLKQDLRGEISV
jgi:L-asparaginase/Glu-tRNA(Gln) amidotransferase subunit D